MLKETAYLSSNKPQETYW